jgi:hypothetical protein
MMADDVKAWPLVNYSVVNGSVSIIAAYGPGIAGLILNPKDAADEGIPIVEPLYVDFTAPATLYASNTTFALNPGQSIFFPEGFAGPVWVNAATTGHRYSGILWQPPPGFVPQDQAAPPGIIPFPPSGPTTLLETIAAYLYQQYSDDDDLQAFVAAYNLLAQQYVDWFVNVNLPIYPVQNGQLLDWIAAGLYGMARPSIPYGTVKTIGPLNTWAMNTIPLNTEMKVFPHTFYLTTDDIFKRILTWHFYKGDGKVFNVRWLKRRIMRFLLGMDGWSEPDGVLGPVDTSPVSISFGADNNVGISIGWMRRAIKSGAIFNQFALNTRYFNEIDLGSAVSVPTLPMAPIFKAAFEAGLLEVPFQFNYTVSIGQ